MKYIIVTYGIPGWRGVQERGVAIGNELGRENVIFWNAYDSKFIKDKGFKVKTINTQLISPKDIKIPKNTKAIIFADLPSNELFNFSLFYAARSQKIPVIIMDQIYRRNQLKEKVFKIFSENSDLLLLNGLNFFRKEETKNIKIIPPLAPYKNNLSKKELKELLAKQNNLNVNKKWVFVSGYYEKTYEYVKKILKKNNITEEYQFIISGIQDTTKTQNPLYLPYLPQNEYLNWIKASDIVICKFGYLQILEIIALRTPLIVAGKAGKVLKMEILDKKIKELIHYADSPKELEDNIIKISNIKYTKNWFKKASKIHDGSFFGAKIAVRYIKKIKQNKNLPQKTVVISLSNEFNIVRKFIKKEVYCYPIIISMPIPISETKENPVKKSVISIENIKVEDLYLDQKNEILPNFFIESILLSQRKYDGLTRILPFYNIWIENLENILKKSDTIFITKRAKVVLGNLLKKFNKKIITI
jgi:hypothetical protein